MTREQAWQHLVGNNIVKRAIEVSMVRQHRLHIYGKADNTYLISELELDHVSISSPCACGNYADIHGICQCEPGQVVRDFPGDMAAWVTTPSIRDYHRGAQESFSTMMQRVAVAQKQALPIDLTQASNVLLGTAIEKLDVGMRRVYAAIEVARSIAQLDQQLHIEAHHIAEAIQYQRLH
jgi:magnesium chelatase family protein